MTFDDQLKFSCLKYQPHTKRKTRKEIPNRLEPKNMLLQSAARL